MSEYEFEMNVFQQVFEKPNVFRSAIQLCRKLTISWGQLTFFICNTEKRQNNIEGTQELRNKKKSFFIIDACFSEENYTWHPDILS